MRWINVSKEDLDRRRYAFFPFSMGGRNCIGEKFAVMEAYLIMAALIRAFEFEIAPSQQNVEHTFTSSITMKTKPDLRIVVKNRV
jgi:cytochrome P450